MNIKVVLASNLDPEIDLDSIDVREPTSGYVLFSNRRTSESGWQSTISRVEVLISLPQVFRQWLWKMRTHKSLPSHSELKDMEDTYGEDAEWAAEVRYYNDIVYCALCFARCESPVVVLNDLADRPAAEVFVRYINYLNSLNS